MPGAAALVDAEGRVVAGNRSLCDLLDCACEQLEGRSLETLLPALSLSTLRSSRSRVVTSARRRDGVEVTVEVRKTPVEIAGRALIALSLLDVRSHEELHRELQAKEALLEVLFESSPDAYYLMDHQGRFRDGNRRAEEMTGFRREEQIGKLFHEAKLLPDEELPRAIEELQKLNAGEEVGPGEYHLLCKDGGVVPVELRARPVEMMGERLILGTARDISHRKNSERRFRELFESAPAMYVITREDEREEPVVADCNGLFLDTLGYERETVIGRRLRDFYAEDPGATPEAQREAGGDAGRSRAPQGCRLRAADGSVVATLRSSLPDRDDEGRLVGTRAMFVDITERKRVEEELRKSEASLETAQRIADLGRWEYDVESREVSCCRVTRRCFGLPEAGPALTAQDFLEAVHPEDRDRIREALARALERKGAYDVVFRTVVPDGSQRTIHSVGEVELGEGDPLTGKLVGVIRDITERRRAEAYQRRLEDQLRHTQKMQALGQLAGGIAHDFNNLLAVIMGHAGLALDMVDDEEHAVISELERINDAAKRADGLVRDLLAFGRRGMAEAELLDLNGPLSSLEPMLARLVGPDIELIVERDQGLGMVLLDEGQLDQLIFNLAVNARDAMPQGGTLTVSTANVELDEWSLADQGVTAAPGAYVRLAVRDTGVGMDEATRSKVFDPFFTTKERGRGTGLGLAAVYGIVKNAGGYIAVTSEPGEGTTVEVFFPPA